MLLLLCPLATFGEPATTRFEAANRLYELGKFSEAAAAYEAIVQTGQVSEPLYFNWGNALFKAGRIGRAIAAYQHAERLAPRDPDVRANLQFARNQVQGPTLLPDRIYRWLGKLSLNEWTWLSAGTVWLWLFLATVMQWRPALQPALKSYSVWLGVLAAVVCVLFGAAFYVHRAVQRGIIVAAELTARQAPLEESQIAFTLHDGAELQVVDQKDQWLQVQVDARRIGWVPRENLVRTP
jgi:tetratricopeptide (TPR) repeat protein